MDRKASNQTGRASPGIEPVMRAVREGARSIRVMRLSGSSPAWLAASVMAEFGAPVLLVSPSEEEAARFCEETAFYLRALGLEHVSRLMPGRKIYKALPYEGRAMRTAALAAMVEAGPGRPAAVSCSAESLVTRTLPPEDFADALFELRAGEQVDRDALLAVLVSSGYTAVSSVMEPGDFSVRGGIIDIYPPGPDLPVRAELWDEEIESLRSFDPATQKSKGPIERTLIPPLKEVIITHETSARASKEARGLAQRLKEEGRRAPGPDFIAAAGQVFDRLSRGEHFPGIESLLPLFYRDEASLLDYAGPEWLIIYMEPFMCEQALLRRAAELREEWENEIAAGGFAVAPGEHFVHVEKVSELIAQCRIITAGVESGEPAGAGNNHAIAAPPPPKPDAGPLPGLPHDLTFLKADGRSENPLEPFISGLMDMRDMGVKTLLVSPVPGKAERMRELLSGRGMDLPLCDGPEGALISEVPACITTGTLQRGFLDREGRLAVVPESEVFGEKIRPRRRRRLMDSFIGDLSDLAEGDYVVHVEHGVGVYRGLESLTVQLTEWDFVRQRQRPTIRMDAARIEYSGGASLFVPVHRINQISKYHGPTDAPPQLDALGGTSWERLKRKVKRSVREFAEYLIRIYAARKVNRGTAFPPPDSTFRAFEESFEYEETPDQLRAIEEVIEDMMQEVPMDRIVCGDVGYGKTEVALRAAFMAAMSGRQVAILAPTTILAQQHYETFIKRLQPYPLEVRVLSRFLSTKEQKKVAAELEKGMADIVIGTHRLLSKDVRFRDLGLLVIDEEHRFGVRHKERLREMRATVDTLTLTATPIPRTLHMALSGLRDLSIIDTPPPDRLAVHTELVQDDDRVIKEAVERELRRGGQVFYVHNRVQTIEAAAARIKRIVPQADVAVAHGQMKERELERVMHEFVEGKHEVLVCSAIIESGLDIPTVNTMIVDHADRFGLAQLYQLRGRIGRAAERGYCWLMVPARGMITKDAAKRLRVLKEFTELGSGFRIAALDLEIRGAGNILGPEQSGQMAKIGIELYMNLLDNEIKALKGEPVEPEIEPEIKLPVAAYLPEDYVPDQSQRLTLYKRLSRAGSAEHIRELSEELKDRYGPMPEPAQNLLEVSRIKRQLKDMRAKELILAGGRISLALSEDTRVDPARLIELATREPLKCQITPDNKVVAEALIESQDRVFEAVREFLNLLTAGDTLSFPG